MLDALVRRCVLPANVTAQIVRPSTLNGRRPTVSVIIPCYNYGRYLPQCVDSVLSQEGVSAEVIVIDDASTDGSDAVVRQVAANDPRVHAICHTVNKGHIATYNEGLAQVSGEYTALLSADDLLTPGCLARAAALMETYPAVGLVYGFPVDFTDTHLPAARTSPRSWIIWPGQQWLAYRCRVGRNIIRSPEVVLRTSVLRQIGGYKATLPHAADFELWMRTATVSDVGFVAGADQAYYRIHPSNMHQSMFDMLDDFSQRLASFDAIFGERSELLDDPERLREAAHLAVARAALSQAVRDTAHRAISRSTMSRAVGATALVDVGEESVDGYAEFALQAWPDAKNLREWHRLHGLFADSGKPPKLNPALITQMAARKATTRFRCWRKRVVGV
ncbi:MAG TPA: glycosyltransferase [Streptosporangiaceae bacterium]|nr:glycosyltransferase [Streptosporangiaceae bacterium]